MSEDKSEWVAVVRGESDAEKALEIQSEPDGTMLLTSITAQFPGTTSLRFFNEGSDSYRGVRIAENVLYPPSKEGWGSHKYICVRPEIEERKRKLEEDEAAAASSSSKLKVSRVAAAPQEEAITTTDLICLGLPFKTTEEEVRSYFSAQGELILVELKKKQDGSSKGFAFLRFRDQEVQEKVMTTRHFIGDRWCDLKFPDSQLPKTDHFQKKEEACKIFVARLTENITTTDLQEHFEQFGQVTDVFYQEKPYRGYAFVSFVDVRVAQSLIGQDHVIKGVSVHIGNANSKSKTKTQQQVPDDSGYGGGASGFSDGGGGRLAQAGFRGGYPGGGAWESSPAPSSSSMMNYQGQRGGGRGGYYHQYY